jgi:hypothetical protein
MDPSPLYGIECQTGVVWIPVTNGEGSKMKLTRVGVDLAKNVFELHGVDRAERPVWCKRLKRNHWIEEIERNVEPGVEIGMEACGGAHH